MEEHEVPAVDSVWAHDSGSLYTILCVANVPSTFSRVDLPAGHTIHANEHAELNRFQEYPEVVNIVNPDGSVTAFTYEELSRGANPTKLEPWIVYQGSDGNVWAQRPEDFHRSRKPHSV